MRRVAVIPYQPRWIDEFERIAERIRAVAGRAVMRIDHIGSTAVPGLGAKDVIDVQLTVSALEECDGLTGALRAAGFRHGSTVEYDVFDGMAETDRELRKLFMREPDGERRAHLHLREAGRFNQRYALLVRDYLRTSEPARTGYERVKRQAAGLFPESIDDYLRLKAPVLHALYEAASMWAEEVGWLPDKDYR
jgi:GrpB-like predicted nucleotidyltransferase (UPF0157 family)